MSCFRLSTLARLSSVMRLGSSEGLQGHLLAATTQHFNCRHCSPSPKAIETRQDCSCRTSRGRSGCTRRSGRTRLLGVCVTPIQQQGVLQKAQQRRLICCSSMTWLIYLTLAAGTECRPGHALVGGCVRLSGTVPCSNYAFVAVSDQHHLASIQ